MNPLESTPDPNPTQPTPEPVPTAAEAALDRLAAIGGDSFDRSEMDKLKEKLAKLPKNDAKTTSGSEAPQDDAPPQPARVLTGRDVDWSEYDLDFNLKHLYPKAVFRDTPQGPKWVAMVTDFFSTTRDFRSYGKRVNQPGSVDKEVTEPLNLGEYLNDMVNGHEEWKLTAVMPIGQQCGVLLERQVPIILPDPQPLKKKEEVEAPTDPALKTVEDAALAFAAEQNGVDNLAPVEEDTTAPCPPTSDVDDIRLRPIEKGTPEHEAALAQVDETGAVQARHGGVVQKALATAAPLTVEAPTAGFEQPEGIENPLLGGAKVPAAGYSAAQDLLRALNDPDFRAKLPTEE